MNRTMFWMVVLLLTAATLPAAPGQKILLEARDLKGKPVPGLRFSYEQVKSRRTTQNGVTELDLPARTETGQKIEIQIDPSSQRTEEWLLINNQVNIPNDTNSAIVKLMRRSEFRQLAAEARDASRVAVARLGKLTEVDRQRALVETAARYGLSEKQLETAIRSFAETQNLKDQGIADYLEGQYPQAEKLLGLRGFVWARRGVVEA